MTRYLSRRLFLKGTAITFSALAAGGLSVPALAAPGNVLVAYFSWSGNTRGIARRLHQKIGGDLIEIELATPYSQDYNTCLDQAKRDQERAARPELKTRITDMARYDVVFLGYPNWWATIPMPIASFLEQYDLSGKTLIPFVSHGGGRLGQSVTDIAKLCPSSKILEALSVRYSGGSSLSGDMDTWLDRVGMKS
ncbi:flavodoxin [Bilophila wadsworthia]|uniref:flavodoxin n=1 Tax=Bilophila wadsworthia TaxID=35833 RepID=UPI003AAB51DE